MPRTKKIVAEPVAEDVAAVAVEEAAPQPKKSRKVKAKVEQPAAEQTAPKERKAPVRRQHTMESVKGEFKELSDKLEAEIQRRRADSSLGGVKFLRAIKKQVESIGKHTAHISLKRPSNRKGNVNSGFLKPVGISKDMAQFAGWDAAQPRSRVDATKALCAYIKEHNLQNPENRREILPDEKLRKLLGFKDGGDPLTYYSMQTYMKPHFKALDGSSTPAAEPKKVIKSKGIKPKKTA